jgi:hypothetical protein
VHALLAEKLDFSVIGVNRSEGAIQTLNLNATPAERKPRSSPAPNSRSWESQQRSAADLRHGLIARPNTAEESGGWQGGQIEFSRLGALEIAGASDLGTILADALKAPRLYLSSAS